MSCTPLGTIDRETADLILRLQLEDVKQYTEASKGKSTTPTDEEIAFGLQQRHLEHECHFLRDHAMALSIAEAVQAEGELIARVTQHQTRTEKQKEEFLDDDILAKLQMMHMSPPSAMSDADGAESVTAESSSWAATRVCDPRRISRCVCCGEGIEYYNAAPGPCGHEYCRPCLRDLFETAMTDESLFPPRCCRQPFDIKVARIFLNGDIMRRFEKKRVELQTVNRTYCYSPACSVFIDSSNILNDVATCGECGCTTCVTCKGRAHTGDCPSDTGLQQLLATAREEGWQRCQSCRRVVELDHGCNHITCRCGTHFCYNCGLKWKTCACAQWNENRLLSRAHQLVDRDRAAGRGDDGRAQLQAGGPGRLGNPQPRRRLVEQAMQELRDNHECEHEMWMRVRTGRHRCEVCRDHLDMYINECSQCRLHACTRCRRNRL
ncbi:hypothetical protein BJX64DRAFT_281643 [Aspergillus heterothallicus]